MRPRQSLFVIMLLCALIPYCTGCGGGSNVGKLFQPRYNPSNPADQGFDGPDGNGAFTVHGLEAGMVFGEEGPEHQAVYPADGSSGVDVNTIVVLRFDQSLGTAEAGLAAVVTVSDSTDGGRANVSGSVSYVAGSARRLVVFVPDAALGENTTYKVNVSATLVDAQGEAVKSSGEVATFETGKAGDDIPFEVISALTLPADGDVYVSERAPFFVFFTESVDTGTGAKGLGGNTSNLKVLRGSQAVNGVRSFEYGDRLLVFTPTADMDPGERIDVTVESTTGNSDGSETLAGDYDFSFTIIGFPRVTGITAVAGGPLIALPANAYIGRIVPTNQHEIDVTVTLEGPGKSYNLTLIFWDNTTKAIILSDKAKRSAGSITYTIDFKPKNDDALSDGVITVGAYTTDSSGTNGPVGPPAFLPDLFKDTVPPALSSLGPPSGSAAGNRELLLEAASAGVHGRASEDLASISVTVDVNGAPQKLDGIVFFSMEYPNGSGSYSQEVTRGSGHLFITEPLAGIDPDTAMDGPFLVTEVVMSDLAGNTTTLTDPADSSVDYRGFVDRDGLLGHQLEVFCHDAVTLLPLADVDVLVDQHSDDYGSHSADRLGGRTGADGRVTFANVWGQLPEDHITVTAVKDAYELTSVLGLRKPSNADKAFLSLPIRPDDGVSGSSTVTLGIADVNEGALPRIYIGGNRLETGTDEILFDAGDNPASATLTAARGKLQFLEAMGVESGAPEDRYQWAWSNPFLAETGASIQAVLFADTLKDVNDLTAQVLETEWLHANYVNNLEARLTARLNGFTGTLPIAVDLKGESLGTGQYSFTLPMTPTLFVNEIIDTDTPETAAFDPPFEVIIEPALGPAGYAGAPDQALLEGALFFEVEEAETGGFERIIRKRIPYDQNEVNNSRVVSFPRKDAFSTELFLYFNGTSHPPQMIWSGVFRIGNSQGAFVIHYSTASGSRHWRITVPHDAYTNPAPHTTVVVIPDLKNLPAGFTPLNDLSDFDSPGSYSAFIEAFEITNFDLNEAFFSDIGRDWTAYWRSNVGNVTTVP